MAKPHKGINRGMVSVINEGLHDPTARKKYKVPVLEAEKAIKKVA